jgi:polyvinyl alcohol dehydrogenase (cytochrome)
VAVEADTGRRIWKTYVIDERPKPTRKNEKGVQLWGPAGGSIWSSPTVDPRRGAVYVGTGDGTTYPPPKTIDAVMALEMTTGKVLWSHQVHENDSFLVGCGPTGRTDNCPEVQGPDWDIPASPILRTLAGGQRVLVVGTKPGDVLALDPDRGGSVIWRVNVSEQPPIGANSPFQRFVVAPGPAAPQAARQGGPPQGGGRMGILWGGAADEQFAYFGLTGGGMAALDMTTGRRVWYTPLASERGGRISNGAAASAIPGVAFVGGNDGVLHALSTSDGKPLWSYGTARGFETVNGVEARGGSIGAIGPVIVDGRVYVGSGYAVLGGGQSGNVLLAFGVD